MAQHSPLELSILQCLRQKTDVQVRDLVRSCSSYLPEQNWGTVLGQALKSLSAAGLVEAHGQGTQLFFRSVDDHSHPRSQRVSKALTAGAVALAVAACATVQPTKSEYLSGPGFQAFQVVSTSNGDIRVCTTDCPAPTPKTRITAKAPSQPAEQVATAPARATVPDRPELQPFLIKAAKDGDSVPAALPRTRVFFDYASSSLAGSAADQLQRLANDSKDAKLIHVRGFADSVGDAAANRRLAIRRALAVRSALLKQGVPAERISTSWIIVDADGTASGRRAEIAMTSAAERRNTLAA